VKIFRITPGQSHRSDKKRIGDVSLTGKWLRHSRYIDYKQCVMDDLGRFREKWVDESNRWGAGLKRGWGEGLLFRDAGTVPNAPSKDLVFNQNVSKLQDKHLFNSKA
jgi:hypothetical protein